MVKQISLSNFMPATKLKVPCHVRKKKWYCYIELDASINTGNKAKLLPIYTLS